MEAKVEGWRGDERAGWAARRGEALGGWRARGHRGGVRCEREVRYEAVRGGTRRRGAQGGAERRSARCAHYAHYVARPPAISNICSNIISVCRAAATSSSLERLVWRALGSHMMARLPLPAPSVCAYLRQSGQHSAVCEPYRHQCRMWLMRQ